MMTVSPGAMTMNCADAAVAMEVLARKEQFVRYGKILSTNPPPPPRPKNKKLI
jgi:hypothetical protein